MSNILVVNSGSTSVKYKLFNENEKEIKGGLIENVASHEEAIKKILKDLADLRDLEVIGHRVVHGGDLFKETIVADGAVLEELEKLNDLAPLHNPYNLAGIRAARDFLPEIPQVAVFDTAFFSSLPPEASAYGLPARLSEQYKIKRYGFHGISHQYVMEEAAKILKKDKDKINLISCHLGGGWSAAAIEKGKPIDTSMGWTPLEGLVMMTRSGDLDPAIVVELIKKAAGTLVEEKCAAVYDLLNRESGIKGLAGVNDYKDLLRNISLGDKDAELALNVALRRLVKYIGAYWAELGGELDALIFTGAIGAGNPLTRNRVMNKLKCLGEVPALAIKTDEELMIAREVRKARSKK